MVMLEHVEEARNSNDFLDVLTARRVQEDTEEPPLPPV
jgi:hypothetical protein